MNNHQIQQDKLIRVLIVDDHPLFRRGVHNLLEAEEDLQPAGEVGSIPEAQEWLSDHTADVVLLDHNLPGINGISGLPRLLEIQTDLQVIVLTVGDNNEDFRQAIRVGACGYLLKDAAPEKLLEAVRMAANHECRISKRMMHTLFQSGSGKFRSSSLELSPPLWPDLPDLEPDSITKRERELLHCLCQGLSNKEIARDLGLSPNTVRNYLQRLQERFEIRNRVQLALLAQDRGYV